MLKKLKIGCIAFIMLTSSLLVNANQEATHTLFGGRVAYSVNTMRDHDASTETLLLNFEHENDISVVEVVSEDASFQRLDDQEFSYTFNSNGNKIITITIVDGGKFESETITHEVKDFSAPNQGLMSVSNESLDGFVVTNVTPTVKTQEAMKFNVDLKLKLDVTSSYRLVVTTKNEFGIKILNTEFTRKIVGDNLVFEMVIRSDDPTSYIKNFDVILQHSITASDRVIPNNHVSNVEIKLVNDNNLSEFTTYTGSVTHKIADFRPVATVKVGQAWLPREIVDVGKTQNVTIGMASGTGSPSNSISTHIEQELSKVEFAFGIYTGLAETTMQGYGLRNYKQVKVTYMLPEGATYDVNLASNNKWVLSDDGKSVTLTVDYQNGAEIYKLNSDKVQSMNFNQFPALTLIFPNYAISKPIVASMTLQLVPHSKDGIASDINDPLYTQSSQVVVNPKLTAYNNPYEKIDVNVSRITSESLEYFYDLYESKVDRVVRWSLNTTNKTQAAFKIESIHTVPTDLVENSLLYRDSILNHMRITKVSIPSLRDILDENYRLVYVLHDGTEIMDDAPVYTEPYTRTFDATLSVKSIKLLPKDADLNLLGGQTLAIAVDMEYLNTADGAVATQIGKPEGSTKTVSLALKLEAKGVYIGTNGQVINTSPVVSAYETSIASTLPDRSARAAMDPYNVLNYTEGSLISVSSRLTLHNLLRNDRVGSVSVIALLPEGVDYVEGSYRITLDSGFRFESAPEPVKIINNYKNTNQIALLSVVPASVVLNNFNLSQFIKVDYQMRPTSIATLNMEVAQYYVIENNDVIKSGYESVSKESADYIVDLYDMSQDSNSPGYVHKTFRNLTFTPDYLLLPSAGFNIPDHPKVQYNVTTEVNVPFKLNQRIKNNKQIHASNITLLGFIPKKNLEFMGKSRANLSTIDAYLNAPISVVGPYAQYFTIRYTKTPILPNETVDAYLSRLLSPGTRSITNPNLIDSDALTPQDYDDIVAYVVESHTGFVLNRDDSVVVEIPVIVEDDGPLNQDFITSSFFVKENNDNFGESNITTNSFAQFSIEGKFYFDVNRNQRFDAEDRLLDPHLLNFSQNGSTVSTQSDAQGNYRVEFNQSGSYSLSTQTNPLYKVDFIEQTPVGTCSSSRVCLSLDKVSARVDAVVSYQDFVLRVESNLYDVNGDPLTQSTASLEYDIEVNGMPYNGKLVFDDLSEVSVINGQTSHALIKPFIITGLQTGDRVDVIAHSSNFESITTSSQSVVIQSDAKLSFEFEIKSDVFETTLTWIGGPLTKPDVRVTLMQNGSYLDQEVIEDSRLTHAWGRLPLSDANGKPHTYMINVGSLSNYDVVVSGLNITLTYIPQTDTLQSNIHWVDGPLPRPDLKLSLNAGNATLQHTTLISGQHATSWGILPIEAADATPITYSVLAEPVADYDITYSGLDVTLTYRQPLQTYETTLTWIGGPLDRPDVAIDLMLDQSKLASITLGQGQALHTWGDYVSTDRSGQSLDYAIHVEPIPNYQISVIGLNVTLTYQAPQALKESTITWIGGPLEKPDLNLALYQGSTAIEHVTLVDGITGYSWGMKVLNYNDGQPVAYAIGVEPVPHYTISIQGLDITLTYVPPQEVLSTTITWVNGPLQRPDVILELVEGTHIVATDTLSDGNTYKAWGTHDGYTLDGVMRSYNLVVKPLQDYSISYQGLNVTLTYMGTYQNLTSTITWLGGPANKPALEIALFEDTHEIQAVTLNDGSTQHSWGSQPMNTADGSLKNYTVSVKPVLNYDIVYDGLNVTMRYKIPTGSLYINTKWVGGEAYRTDFEVSIYRHETSTPQARSQTVGSLVKTVVIQANQDIYVLEGVEMTNFDGIDYTFSVELVTPITSFATTIDGLNLMHVYQENKPQEPGEETPHFPDENEGEPSDEKKPVDNLPSPEKKPDPDEKPSKQESKPESTENSVKPLPNTGVADASMIGKMLIYTGLSLLMANRTKRKRKQD